MKFDKDMMDIALMRVFIWGYTLWGINKLIPEIIILYYPCDKPFTNDALQVKLIFQNDDKVDDEHHISTTETTYEYYKGTCVTFIIDHSKAKFKANTHLAYMN